MNDVNNITRRAGTIRSADIGAVLPASHTAADATITTVLSVSINHAADDLGPETADLLSGQYTDDSQPTLHGSGTPNGIVKIYTENGLLGSVQVNEKGEWSFTPERALSPGVHRFRPEISHQDVEQPLSGQWFELGITEPVLLTPEIMDVRDNEGASSWLKSGATTDDATPTFTGYVDAPGMTIVVRDNNNIIGYIEVEEYGDWIYTPEPALATGSHSLTFEIIDSQGNVHASEPFVLHIAPSAIAKILYADDNVGSVTDSLFSGARTDDTTPTLHGTGTPDTIIHIYYRGTNYLGSAKTNANGEWSFTTPEFSEGRYSFTAREVGANGQLQPAGPGFTLDITPPVPYTAPTISNIYDDVGVPKSLSNNSITDDATPRFTGRGMPNSIIEVRDNDQKIADVQVDRFGNWSWTPNPALQPGNHSFNFVTLGENGEEFASRDLNLSIITQIPGRIISADDNVGAVTGSLSHGARTDDTTPTLKGVGTPGGTVMIYTGRYTLGSVKINENGEWSFTPPGALGAGTHSFQAVVTGPDGTTLPASPPFVLVIAPPLSYTAPTVSTIYDDVGAHKYLNNNSITDDATPRFTGRGMPNSIIEVRDNGQKIADVQVDRNGNWTWTPNPALQPGNHSFNFVTLGENGDEYASQDTNLQIITQIPGRIISADDNVGAVTGSLSHGARTDDTTPALKGVGTPGGTVMIYTGRYTLGSVKINENGEWSFTPSGALGAGTHSFQAVVTGPDGTTLPASPPFVLTIVPPMTYTAPTLTNVYDDAGIQGYLSNGSITDDMTPRFSGRGMPNSIIEVRDNDQKIADVQVDRNGNWSWTPNAALQPGNHSFNFVTIGDNGQAFSSPDFNLQISNQLPGRIISADDNVGAVTDTLSSGARTDDSTPTLQGLGTPGGIVMIYDARQLLGSTTINANGEWSFTPHAPLSTGFHSFTAQVTNPDGYKHQPGAPFDLTIAAPVPFQAPVIDSIYDGEGRRGLVAPGGTSDDTTPTVSGQGAPGSMVIIRDLATGTEVTVQVDAEGAWSWTPVASLSEGQHTFIAIGVDENGQEHGNQGAAYAVNIVYPTDNVITAATDDVGINETLQAGAQTDDNRPTLHGFGLPYGDIWIYDNGRLLGTAIISRDGKWSFTPEQPLAEGVHHFSAMSTDVSSGARTPSSPTFELEIVPVVAPENTGNLRSLLQHADAPLFAEQEPEISLTQPAQPTAFVPASTSQIEEWETVLNHG
ncbi:Ig-like domain-containing protein [Duffyella gerundensis]|uniref:Ig-like domain-containing protein n=1 Tax=Duffyella gerundensis TaxID=1619313 RepID=UPI003F6DDF3E